VGKNDPVPVAQARQKYHFAPASNIIWNQMVMVISLQQFVQHCVNEQFFVKYFQPFYNFFHALK